MKEPVIQLIEEHIKSLKFREEEQRRKAEILIEKANEGQHIRMMLEYNLSKMEQETAAAKAKLAQIEASGRAISPAPAQTEDGTPKYA